MQLSISKANFLFTQYLIYKSYNFRFSLITIYISKMTFQYNFLFFQNISISVFVFVFLILVPHKIYIFHFSLFNLVSRSKNDFFRERNWSALQWRGMGSRYYCRAARAPGSPARDLWRSDLAGGFFLAEAAGWQARLHVLSFNYPATSSLSRSQRHRAQLDPPSGFRNNKL